jgi:hypothetical protein
MSATEVLSFISKRLVIPSSNFGGPGPLVSAIADANDIDYSSNHNNLLLNLQIARLLYHTDSIVMLSPWSFRFIMYEKDEFNGSYSERSCILDEPYSILDTEGRLLYSVSDHLGVFGNSILDKALVMESKSGATYYLQFPTYKGSNRILILLINRVSTTSPISNNYFKSKTNKTDTYQANQISLDASSIYRDPNRLSTPLYPIKVFLLEGTTANVPTMGEMLSSYTSTLDYPMDVDTLLNIHIDKSAWIMFTQITDTGTMPLKVNVVDSPSAKYFMPGAPNIYYMAGSSDTDINLIRQSLGLVSILPPIPGTQKVLNIKGTLLIP